MTIHYATRNNDIDQIEFMSKVSGVSQEPNSIVHVVYAGFPSDDDWIDSIWTDWTKAEERRDKLNEIQTVKEARLEHFILNKPEGEWTES